MEYKYSKSVNQHEYGRVNRAISPVCTRVYISWIFKEGDVTGSIQVLERGISGTNTGERAWFSFERCLHLIFEGQGVGNRDFW